MKSTLAVFGVAHNLISPYHVMSTSHESLISQIYDIYDIYVYD